MKKKVPQPNADNLISAHLMIGLWEQFGSDGEGDLVCNFMGAPEMAGEWLEDLGLVRDVGTVFQLTDAGKLLMDVNCHDSITPEVIKKVCEAIK